MSEYDLQTEPWIPCITTSRQYCCFGLRDVIAEAHNLREVHGDTPLITVAIYRFLLAVLHSVPRYKIRSPDGWKEQWKKGQFDTTAVNTYLDQWRARFYLFHPQFPFFQDCNTPGARPDPKERRNHDFGKPIATLMHEISSGNNAAWFDHTFKSDSFGVDAATAARAVLATLSFGLGGTGASGGNFSHAPLVNDVVFLAQGDNLFETLMLNLYLYTDGDPLPETDDRPLWEHDQPLESRLDQVDVQNIARHPAGYLDMLTWPSRRVLLRRDEDGLVRWIKLDQGWVMDSDDVIKDTMKAYHDSRVLAGKGGKKGKLPAKVALRWDESRSLWRDSVALFRLQTEYGKSSGFSTPAIIRNLQRLVANGVLDRSKVFRCAAFGLCADKASVQFFRAEQLPLPMTFLADTSGILVGRLDALLQISNRAGQRLVQAVRAMADQFLQPNEETRKTSKTGQAAQAVLGDLDALLSLLDEGQASEVTLRQEKRDESLAQRGGWRADAERRFWAAMGERFYEYVLDLAKAALETEEMLNRIEQNWRRTAWQLARQAFDESALALGSSDRALKAYAIGDRIFNGHYLLPDLPKSQMEDTKSLGTEKEQTHEPQGQRKRGARSRRASATTP